LENYSILYTESSVTDIEAILDYLKQHSISAANKFIDNFNKKIKTLISFPRCGAIPKIEKLQQQGYRIMVLRYRYLLFYKLNEKDKVIIIERVLHGARDLEKILI